MFWNMQVDNNLMRLWYYNAKWKHTRKGIGDEEKLSMEFRLHVAGWLVMSAGLCPASFAAELTIAQQRTAAKVPLRTFRTSKDAQKQRCAVEQLLKIGPAAADQASRAVESMLKREIAIYLKYFGKQAIRLGATKARSIRASEVHALRAEVLAMRELGDGLTVELLREKGLPALAKLREYLMVSPEDVLASDDKLEVRRERLLELGEQLRRARDAIGAEFKAKDPPPSTPFPQALAEYESAATIESLPISPNSKAMFAANSQQARRLDPQSVAAIRRCNLTRALLGLSVLQLDPRLIKAGVIHSKDMETHKFFDHTSPVKVHETPAHRARLAGTTASGENIYVSSKDMPGDVVSDAWFTSPPHHRNMLGDHRRVGVGRHGKYFTQVFGR